MNVILITSNADALREASQARSVLLEQAKLVNRLTVVVLNTRRRMAKPHKVSDKLWIFPTNSWHIVFAPFDALKIIRQELFFRNNLQADIFVAHEPLLSAFVAIIASRRYKRPLNIHVPENIFSGYNPKDQPKLYVRSIIERIFIGFAHSVSVSSQATRAALVRKDPDFADRVSIVPQYVNAMQASEGESGDEEEDLHLKYTQFRAILLLVAPLSQENNITLAIDALAEVSQYHQNIGLVIVGSGIAKIYLKHYANLKGVGDKVKFEPPRMDMTPLYKSAYALMATSLNEEYSNVIAEAAAAGCVLISSRVSTAVHIIENRENSFLCETSDPKDYVDAINTLLSNERLRMTMRERIAEAAKKIQTVEKDDHLSTLIKSWEDAITMAKGY